MHSSLPLLLPTSGLVRGLSAVFHCAILSNSDLETASKAGALCIIVRSRDWKPMHRDRIEGIRTENLPSDIASRDSDEISIDPHNPGLASEEQTNDEPQTEALLRNSQASWHSSCGRTVDAESFSNSATETPANPVTETLVTGTSGPRDLPIAKSNLPPSFLGTLRLWNPLLPSSCTWKPQKDSCPFTRRKVYGTCDLPQGYELSMLPAGVQFCDMDGNKVIQVDQRSWSTRAAHDQDQKEINLSCAMRI